MEDSSGLLDMFYVNLPTTLVIGFAFFYLRKSNDRGLFILGLLLVLASGILAVPLVSWLWATYPDFMSNSMQGTVLVTMTIGILHSVGLVCCIVDYRRR